VEAVRWAVPVMENRIDGEHRQGFNNRSASVNLRWAF
jgi:hypothetical protein